MARYWFSCRWLLVRATRLMNLFKTPLTCRNKVNFTLNKHMWYTNLLGTGIPIYWAQVFQPPNLC